MDEVILTIDGLQYALCIFHFVLSGILNTDF